MQIAFQNIPRQTFYNTGKSSNPALRITNQPTCDTVKFTGHWDLLKLSDKTIFERIKEAIEDKRNYIGEGGQARVYKIPNSNYCVRIEKHDSNYKPVLDRNITECDRINHVVAKFGDESSIMHYIEGVPVLTPDSNARQAQITAQSIAQMPVKSFKDFLKQICNAYDNDMIFDCAWGNVIVNSKENKLTAIDFCKNICNESLKPLSYTLSALMHEYTTPQQTKIYANKILNAALEEFEPSHKPFWNVTYFDFSSLLRNVAIKTDYGRTPQCKLLEKNLETLKDLKVKDLRGIDVSQNLNGTLKVIKALINQTL
ncbi:MAG: hypothetical protein K2F57_00655 [Candidatus Gastranaerophilales bacterium]|nr:hypothetical protein [Candidatus Gastranaerophilales bacterium]